MRGRTVVAGVLLVVAMAGCGKAEAACGDAFAESLDPKSSTHVLPGAEIPKYKTNPPTSGAHRGGGINSGVSDVALDKPDQVNVLESGAVLLQYNDLADDDLLELRSFAGKDVVVAPNSSLKKPIVATAWLQKMECRRYDGRALQQFLDAYIDKAPGH